MGSAGQASHRLRAAHVQAVSDSPERDGPVRVRLPVTIEKLRVGRS